MPRSMMGVQGSELLCSPDDDVLSLSVAEIDVGYGDQGIKLFHVLVFSVQGVIPQPLERDGPAHRLDPSQIKVRVPHHKSKPYSLAYGHGCSQHARTQGLRKRDLACPSMSEVPE